MTEGHKTGQTYQDSRLEDFLMAAGERHNHVCPRIVLGVRMGLLAESLLGLSFPQTNKRLLTLVETDGCFADGVAVVTGCELGHRTLRLVDYGRVAATFIDTKTEKAIRIAPTAQSRALADEYAPEGRSRWHRYRDAYKVMPDEEMLIVQHVTLNFSITELVSRAGVRTNCDICGEEIVNEREVIRDGQTLCPACAHGAYYTVDDAPQADGLREDVLGYLG